MIQKVFNLIILDESGSMCSIEAQTISGLNETIQTIKSAQRNHPEQEHYVTLMSFNSIHQTYHYNCKPAMNIRKFNGRDYKPECCTPLLDAIGAGISKLRKQVEPNDQVLVTIITDGLENDSREYNSHAITNLIDKLRAEGGVITYIGANQDAHKVAEDLHINNSLNFDATPMGTCCMMMKERKSRLRFFDSLSEGCARPDAYFDEDDKS